MKIKPPVVARGEASVPAPRASKTCATVAKDPRVAATTAAAASKATPEDIALASRAITAADGAAAQTKTSTNPIAHMMRTAASVGALPAVDSARTRLFSPQLHGERAQLAGLSCGDEFRALLEKGQVCIGATEDVSPLGRLVSLDRQLRLQVSPLVLTMDPQDPLVMAALVRAIAAAKIAHAKAPHNGSDAWRQRVTGLLVGDALVRSLSLTDASDAVALPRPPGGPIFYPAAGMDVAGIETARKLFPSATSAVCADLGCVSEVVTRDATGTFTTEWRKRDLVQEPMQDPSSVVWLRAPGDFATLMSVPRFVAGCLASLREGGVCAIDGSWAAKPLLLHLPLSIIGFAPGPLIECQDAFVAIATKARSVSPEHMVAALDLDRAIDVLCSWPSPFYLPDLQEDGSLTARALAAKTPDEQLELLSAIRRAARALGGKALGDVVDDALACAVARRRGQRDAFQDPLATAMERHTAAPAVGIADPQLPPQRPVPSHPLTFADLQEAASTLVLTHKSPLSAFDDGVAALSDEDRVAHADAIASMRDALVAVDTAEARALLSHGLVDEHGRVRTAPTLSNGFSRGVSDALDSLVRSGAREEELRPKLRVLAEQALAHLTPTLAAEGMSSSNLPADPRDPLLKAVLNAAIDRGVIEQAMVDARIEMLRSKESSPRES